MNHIDCEGNMKDTNNTIRRVAGIFVITSLALGYLVNPLWHLLTAFVGVNLFQSSFTHWCPLEKILVTFDSGEKT
jgi:Inner membrane protein YgaP-like, transmembrane domain